MPDQSPDAARELFEQLLELPEPERETRLQELTVDNVALEARVRRLLEAHERATGFDSVIPTPPDIALPDPEHIGPYRVLEKLGEGGMGVVYLGEQKKPVRRRVAIKIVRPGMASAEVINRFNAERQALALMSHPGISRILDAGATENGLPYFIMEYVPGIPLIGYCDEHQLNLRQRVSLARLVCLAVQHAHQKGVIHRDLKPSNILVVEEDGEPLPKIIDFGIAKAMSQPLTDGTLHTRIGKLIGTPDYMSPEQCNSGSVDVDTRSDVYSLGVLLYQLLSSQLPYNFDRSKDNEVTILRRIVDEDPPPPSRRARDAAPEDAANRGLGDAYSLERRIRGELDWIVSKALERDRNRRYDSAQALADDLERFLDNELVAAGPPSIGYRTGKFVRRHALGVSLLSIAFLMLTSFAGLMMWQVSQTELQRDRANREAEIAKQVTRFTAGLFELAGPGQSGKGDVSARELLDIGVRRLEVQNVPDDAVRAALLEAAGNAYLGLDAHTEALPLLKASADIRRSYSGENPQAYADALLSLAAWHTATSELEPAERYAREAISMNDSLEAREQLAEALRLRGQLAEAASLLEESPSDGSNEMRARVHLELGRIRVEQGRFDDAMQLIRQAIDIFDESNQLVSADAIDALNALGEVQFFAGRHDDAAMTFHSALRDAERIFGKNHSVVGVLLNNLGAALYMIGQVDYGEKLDEAIETYQRALEVQLAQFGENHVEVANVHNNLGNAYLLKKDWEKARSEIDIALTIRRNLLGDSHPDVLTTQLSLAIATARLGDIETAIELATQVRDGMTRELGAEHWRTANARNHLGNILKRAGRLEEADTELAAAVDIYMKSLGPDHDRTIKAQESLQKLRSPEPASLQ
jgi:non-specific serine/threonine protein kinase/serine/threonine-protein kinase